MSKERKRATNLYLQHGLELWMDSRELGHVSYDKTTSNNSISSGLSKKGRSSTLALHSFTQVYLVGFLLASKLAVSVLPGETPNTRNILLDREGISLLKISRTENMLCFFRAYLQEPVAACNPLPLIQHSNLSKMESFSYKSQSCKWPKGKREQISYAATRQMQLYQSIWSLPSVSDIHELGKLIPDLNPCWCPITENARKKITMSSVNLSFKLAYLYLMPMGKMKVWTDLKCHVVTAK